MGRWDDTINNVDTRLGLNPHAPYMFDELKDEIKTRKVVDIIMNMDQGRSKGRNSRSSQALPTMSWNTIMVTASNFSVANQMDENVNTTVAGVNRVFEIYAQPNQTGAGLVDRSTADAVNAALDRNFGHAAMAYAAFLGKDPDFIWDFVQRMKASVGKSVQEDGDDRYHVATVSTILSGLAFAQKLDLINIDLDRQAGFMIEQLQEQRRRRKASTADLTKEDNVLRFIEEYFSFRRDCRLVTDIVWRAASRAPNGWSAGNPNRFDLKNVYVHASRQDKVVRFALGDFRDFLKRQDVNRVTIIEHILRIPAARKTKAYLGHGTMYREDTRQDVIELDLTKLPPDFYDYT